MCLKIRNLNKNFDNLQMLLESFNHKSGIISLSET